MVTRQQNRYEESARELDDEATSKLKNAISQNSQDFMQDRTVISRFDPLRKENIIKK